MYRTAFLPGVNEATAGFFFWPALPRALAAFLTLALGGLVSLAVFRVLERPSDGSSWPGMRVTIRRGSEA